jgi:hypothetical protein
MVFFHDVGQVLDICRGGSRANAIQSLLDLSLTSVGCDSNAIVYVVTFLPTTAMLLSCEATHKAVCSDTASTMLFRPDPFSLSSAPCTYHG